MAEIAAKTLQAAKGVLEEAKESGDAAVRRVADRLMSVEAHLGRVIEQSRQVNSGKAHIPDRLVSIFDPHARPIQRGKLDRPTEFGYKVCLTESEERVVAEYQVFKGNPPDSALLVDAVQGHCQRVDRAPTRTATDRGLWSPTHPNAPSGVFFFITT